MLSAIIVAGGSSQRMGFDKTFALLCGEPLLVHSLAAFENTPCVDAIVLVGRADCLLKMRETAGRFPKVRSFVAGGARRQDSVQRGLQNLPNDTEFVAVHDAARPLVRPAVMERIFRAAEEHGGASAAAPVVDTLKRVDATNLVVGGVERENLFAVQTPQIFRRDILEKAYAELARAGAEVTDEISAVERIGGKVVLVPNESPNFKITFPSDLELAEVILRAR